LKKLHLIVKDADPDRNPTSIVTGRDSTRFHEIPPQSSQDDPDDKDDPDNKDDPNDKDDPDDKIPSQFLLYLSVK